MLSVALALFGAPATTGPATASEPDAGTAAAPVASVAGVIADVGRREAVEVVSLRRTADGLQVESVAALGAGQAGERVAEVLSDPAVVAVEVDTPVSRAGDPDPRLEDQWGMKVLDVEQAWQLSRGAGAVVAVLDSGVDAAHPDLAGAVLPGINTRDNRGDTSDPGQDANGHGTHVAGVIAARADNAIGGAGVAPEAKILPVKVLDRYGGGWVSDVVEGIVWATAQGADVINLSLGGEDSDLVDAAVAQALAAGVVVVAAAGNEGTDQPRFPAALPGVISVAALGPDGAPSGYSNRGDTVDLQAPGDAVLSTIPGGYGAMTGTSMAAPFVAGAAALVRSARPGSDAAALLIDSATPNPRAPSGYGAGVVDPAAALGAGCGAACTPEFPAAAADEATLMAQSVEPPTQVKSGRAKALPSTSDIGVVITRWRSLSKKRCAVRGNRDAGRWRVVGKSPGACRLRVVVPPEPGFRSLRTTIRVTVVGPRSRSLPE